VYLSAEVVIERRQLLIFRWPAQGLRPASPSGVPVRHRTSCDRGDGTA
jgi:hypothetical protein